MTQFKSPATLPGESSTLYIARVADAFQTWVNDNVKPPSELVNPVKQSIFEIMKVAHWHNAASKFSQGETLTGDSKVFFNTITAYGQALHRNFVGFNHYRAIIGA